ncbi:Uncharacterized protein GBIM_07797 [Gryllus bimaculatus]|nr:Uncharacterized protein GBIM_07797 [Gryllus bimaculatus]
MGKRNIKKMEEIVRSMLQYKSKAEQLKQEKTTLTVAYETRLHQIHGAVAKLGLENDALKQQLRSLEAASNGARGLGDVERSVRVVELTGSESSYNGKGPGRF